MPDLHEWPKVGSDVHTVYWDIGWRWEKFEGYILEEPWSTLSVVRFTHFNQ